MILFYEKSMRLWKLFSIGCVMRSDKHIVTTEVPCGIRMLSAHMDKVKEWKKPQWTFIFKITDNEYKGIDSTWSP